MTNPLDGMEEELAKMERDALLEQLPSLPEGTLAKVESVSRANALVQLTAMASDEARDDMVRMGAANIILQATMANEKHYLPTIEVRAKDEPEA